MQSDQVDDKTEDTNYTNDVTAHRTERQRTAAIKLSRVLYVLVLVVVLDDLPIFAWFGFITSPGYGDDVRWCVDANCEDV